eukprot:TRINITY_DN10873_c0_g1_i1.p1 TRINITY_DN10873_c0_g1~~TRINITY_DN10873_c0_g1_i1.p1  ORF type:complete len:820 (-),score=226.09 TRINITY_DN10873_c0_g1_i1:8-2467(-)
MATSIPETTLKALRSSDFDLNVLRKAREIAQRDMRDGIAPRAPSLLRREHRSRESKAIRQSAAGRLQSVPEASAGSTPSFHWSTSKPAVVNPRPQRLQPPRHEVPAVREEVLQDDDNDSDMESLVEDALAAAEADEAYALARARMIHQQERVQHYLGELRRQDPDVRTPAYAVMPSRGAVVRPTSATARVSQSQQFSSPMRASPARTPVQHQLYESPLGTITATASVRSSDTERTMMHLQKVHQQQQQSSPQKQQAVMAKLRELVAPRQSPQRHDTHPRFAHEPHETAAPLNSSTSSTLMDEFQDFQRQMQHDRTTERSLERTPKRSVNQLLSGSRRSQAAASTAKPINHAVMLKKLAQLSKDIEAGLIPGAPANSEAAISAAIRRLATEAAEAEMARSLSAKRRRPTASRPKSRSASLSKRQPPVPQSKPPKAGKAPATRKSQVPTLSASKSPGQWPLRPIHSDQRTYTPSPPAQRPTHPQSPRRSHVSVQANSTVPIAEYGTEQEVSMPSAAREQSARAAAAAREARGVQQAEAHESPRTPERLRAEMVDEGTQTPPQQQQQLQPRRAVSHGSTTHHPQPSLREPPSQQQHQQPQQQQQYVPQHRQVQQHRSPQQHSGQSSPQRASSHSPSPQISSQQQQRSASTGVHSPSKSPLRSHHRTQEVQQYQQQQRQRAKAQLQHSPLQQQLYHVARPEQSSSPQQRPVQEFNVYQQQQSKGQQSRQQQQPRSPGRRSTSPQTPPAQQQRQQQEQQQQRQSPRRVDPQFLARNAAQIRENAQAIGDRIVMDVVDEAAALLHIFYQEDRRLRRSSVPRKSST